MPWFDDFDEREPASLEDILFNEDSDAYDPVAWELFEKGVIADDEAAYDELVDYLDYMYDIDFEAEFDWEMY